MLHIPDVDQGLIVYSAALGTRDAEGPALLPVIGMQDLAASGR